MAFQIFKSFKTLFGFFNISQLCSLCRHVLLAGMFPLRPQKDKKKKKEHFRSSSVCLLQFHPSNAANQHKQGEMLTCVTGGSGVSGSITRAAETVPSLFTSAAMFAVVGHAPLKDTKLGNDSMSHVKGTLCNILQYIVHMLVHMLSLVLTG